MGVWGGNSHWLWHNVWWLATIKSGCQGQSPQGVSSYLHMEPTDSSCTCVGYIKEALTQTIHLCPYSNWVNEDKNTNKGVFYNKPFLWNSGCVLSAVPVSPHPYPIEGWRIGVRFQQWTSITPSNARKNLTFHICKMPRPGPELRCVHHASESPCSPTLTAHAYNPIRG